MTLRRIVVVGASLAGLSAARELRQAGFKGQITIVGEEAERPYDRPPLSKQIITGNLKPEELALENIEEKLDIEWLLGITAKELDLDNKAIHLEDGNVVEYDGLIIATGARPRVIPGADLRNVYTLRTMADAVGLKKAIDNGARNIVIVGGGFIGAEVAASARSLGMEVNIIEAADAPMQHILGSEVGTTLADLHREKGVAFHLGIGVEKLLGDDRVTGIRLTNGNEIPADIVVLSIGVVPNTEWLENSGLEIDNGIVCDETTLAAPNVVAAGDVARWPNQINGEFRRVEHWDNAVRHGEHAARRLLAEASEDEPEPYTTVPWVWSDQYDRKFQIVGSPAAHDEVRIVRDKNRPERFTAFYRKGDYLGAVFGSNQTRKTLAYRKRIEDRLLWSEAIGELELEPAAGSR